jgi:Outer membrane protein beta-barrel domain
MLNLSDKEMDRLAREAANEYDPGNPAGPGSWDRMQLRLDNEMGTPRYNPFRSIRRTPFYYAPAILLLIGVSYFLLRPSHTHSGAHPPGSPSTAKAEPSGSPPIGGPTPNRPTAATADKPIKKQINTYSPTSTPASATSANDVTIHSRPESAGSRGQTVSSGQIVSSEHSASPDHSASSEHAVSPEHAATSEHATSSAHATLRGHATSPAHAMLPGPFNETNAPATQEAASANANAGTLSRSPGSTRSGDKRGRALQSAAEANLADRTIPSTTNATSSSLSLSVVRGIQPTHRSQPIVDDAGLRMIDKAPVAKAAEPINPGKKRSPSLHLDRPLQIGISLAPDFTSVNSLAGDKPGSSFGLTADYQLFDKWHIHTGLLLSHKNYTADPEDYHVPYDYYRMNNMHDVYFVKGTINLFEIPLSLRYDFSVAGNTTFFVSGGLSSYLLTHENCNYYFDLFGRTVYQEFKYNGHQNALFSTVDLSMGVETGLTNSLSLLIAPYMKIPTSGLGFGHIEMNSVGVEFGLKYTPVLRRRRH